MRSGAQREPGALHHEEQQGEITRFLVRAAQEFLRGGWVFTGFNWPILAGHLARSLTGRPFAQVFEAGAICTGRPASLPSSTTDYDAYLSTLLYSGSALDVLGSMIGRVDTAVLDAANLDIRGCLNSSFIGDHRAPTVRLPGGGGSPDVMSRAPRIVLLHAGATLDRLTSAVEHVTASPDERADVRLICRWGVLQLGTHPRLLEILPGPRAGQALRRLTELGVEVEDARGTQVPTPTESEAARTVLAEAAGRGYVAAAGLLPTRDRPEAGPA
jgi:glutaconate CoA-transferase subunit B